MRGSIMSTRHKVNVMAPLVVGDPHNIDSESSRKDWAKFRDHLKEMARIGVEAVSTDVWWGLIEPVQGQFEWAYYDKLVNTIVEAGLKWVPILSFHRCGGNIGDTVNVPVPVWAWEYVRKASGAASIRDVQFVSEQGNASDEFISTWAIEHAMPLFEAVMREFQAHFADKAEHIAEVNVSMGPAGELRYPSYNNHDDGTDYPTRGALQCYSRPAIKSFRQWALDKYGTESGIDEAWGTNVAGGQQVRPPSNPKEFFGRFDHHDTQYGRDFFDWYSDSLFKAGRQMMTKALEIFAAEDAAFSGIDIGAKVPGIHWRTGERHGEHVHLGDRLAELAAGLIRTSGKDWVGNSKGRGYRPLLKLMAEFQNNPRSRVVLHFTCLEMPDGEGGSKVKSVAKSLVTWVGQEAIRQGVPIKGENAVWWTLSDPASWERMRSHLSVEGTSGSYEGLTILRMGNVATNPTANAEMIRTIEYAGGKQENSSDDGDGKAA